MAVMPEEILGEPLGKGRRVGIVAARFNQYVVTRLVDGAVKALAKAGVKDGDVLLTWVPGAFEIPAAARHLAGSGRVDAVVTLGCVLKGETPHFDFVAGTCADGVARLALEAPVPVAFGVLTCLTLDQALARSNSKGDNRGAHAALAALEMANLAAKIGTPRKRSVAKS